MTYKIGRLVRVKGTLVARTAKAVLITTEVGSGWIPRSCLSPISNELVNGMELKREHVFTMMDWAAERQGLI